MKKSLILLAAVAILFVFNSCGPSACDCADAVIKGDLSMAEDCANQNFSIEDLSNCN